MRKDGIEKIQNALIEGNRIIGHLSPAPISEDEDVRFCRVTTASITGSGAIFGPEAILNALDRAGLLTETAAKGNGSDDLGKVALKPLYFSTDELGRVMSILFEDLNCRRSQTEA